MPFKRNPINAEKIDSLARMLAAYPQVAWQNAANSLLERTLDDSANRRMILPEAFLTADEMLQRDVEAGDENEHPSREHSTQPGYLRPVCLHREGDDGSCPARWRPSGNA